MFTWQMQVGRHGKNTQNQLHQNLFFIPNLMLPYYQPNIIGHAKTF